MPVTLDPHVYSSVSRTAGRAMHVLSQRLRRANVPLLVVFISLLFMFLRALSGAGYVDPHSYGAPPTTLNYSHLAKDGSIDAPGYAGFAEHWARFKESVLSCPTDDDTGFVGIGEGLDSDNEVDGTGVAKPSTRVGVECLKERLSGVIGLSRPNGPAVKQEDRAFGVSLDGIVSRKSNRETP